MSNSSEQPDEKIIQYLDGELTGTELVDFERVLEIDPSLMERLRRFELARQAVQYYGLKQQVATVHNGIIAELKNDLSKQDSSKIYPLIRISMRIAASLLILCAIVGIYQFFTLSPSKLAAEGYHSYELSVTRGINSPSPIEKDYLDKNFNAVITDLEKNTSPATHDRFLAAQAYLAVHQPANAIAEFSKVLADPLATQKDDSEYYLAMSYLQNNEPVKARPLLDKIYSDNDHLYHNQVTWWKMLKLKLLLIKDPGK